jgi:hypothetical protein
MIKFKIPDGCTVPLILEVEVDDTPVTYVKVNGGIHFTVWENDSEKALAIVTEIIKQIKLEHDGASWRTRSLEVTEEEDWYVCVEWKYYVLYETQDERRTDG